MHSREQRMHYHTPAPREWRRVMQLAFTKCTHQHLHIWFHIEADGALRQLHVFSRRRSTRCFCWGIAANCSHGLFISWVSHTKARERACRGTLNDPLFAACEQIHRAVENLARGQARYGARTRVGGSSGSHHNFGRRGAVAGWCDCGPKCHNTERLPGQVRCMHHFACVVCILHNLHFCTSRSRDKTHTHFAPSSAAHPHTAP